MNDPLMQRELELARMRADERARVADVDRLLRAERAAEPKATDALLDAVAAALIGAGERLKARQIHRVHPSSSSSPCSPCACPEHG